jgi:hypothetical protein
MENENQNIDMLLIGYNTAIAKRIYPAAVVRKICKISQRQLNYMVTTRFPDYFDKKKARWQRFSVVDIVFIQFFLAIQPLNEVLARTLLNTASKMQRN